MRSLAIAVFAALFGWNAATQATEPSASEQLATPWKNYYEFDCDTAAKNAATLLKSSDLSIRLHGQHIQARAIWAIGDPALKKQAQGIWTRLSNAGQSDPSATLRLATARLLVADAAAATQSAAALEAMLEKPPLDVAAVEAWIDLANYYAGVERKDAATSSLDAADKFITDSLGTSEEGDPLWAVFRRAIKDARSRIHDPGKMEFDRAIGLMKTKRYDAARQQFAVVIERFPRTDYAPRSDLAIGDCWLSQGRPDTAEQSWSAFVTAMPAGPWRGHALVRLIDLQLEQFLDSEKAGSYAQMLETGLPVAMGDPLAKPSWESVLYDAHYRMGVVHWLDGQFEKAALAVTRAAEHNKNEQTQAGLERLIAGAKAQQPLVPSDVRGSSTSAGSNSKSSAENTPPARLDQPTLALSVGVIHLAAGQLAKAEVCFNKVLDRKAPERLASSSAQGAFANFGQGAVLQDRGKLAEARAQLQASLKAFPTGSWHDETLFRIATTVQAEADKEFASTAGKNKPEGQRLVDQELTAKERDAVETSQKQRIAAHVKTKSEALPYWQELVKRYLIIDPASREATPTSPRVEQALYGTGVLLCDMADVAPREKTEQLWRDADEAFRRMCEVYPTSVCLGNVYVRRLDLALEKSFDLELSNAVAEQGVQWANSRDFRITAKPDGTVTPESLAEASKAIRAAATDTPLWTKVTLPSESSVLHDIYNLYLRAGILAYLQDKYDEAAKHLAAAGPARPTDGMEANFDLQKVGLFILGNACKRQVPAWYAEAIDEATSEKQKLALKLADTYLFAQRPDKAEAIYLQVSRGDSPLGRPSAAIEAYCWMQMALAYSKQDVHRDKSIEF